MAKLNQHTIYLAGGCFWGVEEYRYVAAKAWW